jgi:hypothetical protein
LANGANTECKCATIVSSELEPVAAVQFARTSGL